MRRERGDEFGPLAWRNEIAHPIGRVPGGRRSEVVIADAVMSYDRYEPGPEVFSHWAFVELDRATMTVEALVAKLDRYLRLLDYAGPPDKRRAGSTPLWRERYPRFPAVLVVLANGSRRRLSNRQWLVQSVWREHEERGSRRIRLRVCLLEDLIEEGPFAPIFLSNRHKANQLVDWRGRPPNEPQEDPQPAECDELEPPPEPEPVDEPEPAPPPPADPWRRW